MSITKRKEIKVNELALFAGAGGGILGGKLLGWRTICAVEWESYPASVLLARQNDGMLPPFPIWDDVQTFDGKPWRGRVDVVSGGFPCQDISCAGKGAGIDGERSGMWGHMARIISEVLPRFVYVENSPMLVGRGLVRVISDLAKMGYDAKWGIVGAHHVSAPHKRDRIWIVAANSNLCGCNNGGDIERQLEIHHAQIRADEEDQQSGSVGKHRTSEDGGNVADTEELFSYVSNYNGGVSKQSQTLSKSGDSCRTENLADSTSERQQGQGKSWFWCDPAEKSEGETDYAFSERIGHIWGIKSPLGRVADGVAARVDRLKAIGNGQVPSVARLAWETLKSTK